MASIKLSLALVDHCDLTAAIVDGSITPQGVDFIITTAAPSELFRRIAQLAEFERLGDVFLHLPGTVLSRRRSLHRPSDFSSPHISPRLHLCQH